MGIRKSILIIMAVAAALTACEKPDLSTPEDKKQNNQGTVDTTNSETLPHIIGVGQLIYAASYLLDDNPNVFDNVEGVTGYIVGCCEGTRLENAKFYPPFSTKTNLLIADSPNEDNALACLPVQLPAHTTLRQELNLVDNPNNYKRKIRVSGGLNVYFETYGIKPLISYSWLTQSPDTTHSGTQLHNPVISTEEKLIEGGR